jgi:ArsR family metal-binding transcriptional regulator
MLRCGKTKCVAIRLKLLPGDLNRTCVPGGERINLEVQMATLQQQIAEKFLAKLAESKDVDAEKIDQLRILLADNKKLKADNFLKIFSQPAGGDLK